MKPHRITLQDIGPFTDLVDVDLDALARGIVCLAGNNGTGKTIFLESILAGVTRKLPSYGDLADMATSKDAYLQVEFTTKGRRWKARHEIGKGCAYLYNDKGRVLDEKGKITPFEEWVAENVIPLDVTLASWVRTQESCGFIGLARGDRKSVVLQAKGSEEAARLADRARKRAKALERDLAEKTRAVDAERGRALPVDVAQRNVAAAKLRVEETAAAEESTRQALDEANAARAGGVAAATLRREQAETRQRAEGRVATAAKLVETLSVRKTETEALLANAPAVEMAVFDSRIARTAREQTVNALHAAEGVIRTKRAEADGHLRDSREATRKLRDLEALRLELEAITKQRADAEDGARQAVVTATSRKTNQQRFDVVQLEIDALRESATQKSDGRVGALRGSLVEVDDAKTIAGARKVAKAGLAADDDAAAGIDQKRLAALQDEAKTLTEQLKVDMQLLAKLERRADLIPTIEKAERGLVKLAEDTKTAEAERLAADQCAAAAKKEADDLAAHGELLSKELAQYDARIRSLDVLCAQQKQLDQADARLTEVVAQIEQATAGLTAARAELEALPPVPAGPHEELPPIDTVELAASLAKSCARGAADALARAEEALTQAEASAVRLVTLKAEESAVGDELADVATLAETLGPNGVQALLVDAAGPELAEGMNALLHGSVGPRWTIAVETTRPDARGKREIEAMLLNVTDEVRGLVREARFHCGGERVFMNEAVAIVIASMSGASYGIDGGTLLRDESSAAFRDHNIPLWLAMIRSGLARYGLDRAILVSHHQEAIDLADQVIEVVDGGLRAVR